LFQPLVIETSSGGASKTTADIIKKHVMVVCRRTGFDPMFLNRKRLQKMSIKVQVPNANLVTICTPYGDALQRRPATRKADASLQRAVVERQPRMGSHHGQLLGKCRRCLALGSELFITNLSLYDSFEERNLGLLENIIER
jgi:hypothetical protein